MKTIIHDEPRTALDEFADELGLTMLVWFKLHDTRYYVARFDDGFFESGPHLLMASECGETVKEAVQNYARSIRGETMILRRTEGDELVTRRVKVPDLLASALPDGWDPYAVEERVDG